MKVLDLTVQKHLPVGIVAFGFFDSIHLGHRAVIKDALDIAKEQGVPSAVFLFKNNIFPLLGIEKYPLFTFEERVALLEPFGVDYLLYVDADRAFLSLSAEQFLSYLTERVEIAGFTCGADFTFGRQGLGTPADLANRIGGLHKVSDLLLLGEEKVSTDGVKRALKKGDLSLAARLLGRPFALTRTVTSGRRDGAKIGYPTINFELGTLPIRRGVYFTNAHVDGVRYRAITNVGAHPTFGDVKENVESYLLDYSGDLYGREVKVEFLCYRREIVAFGEVSVLVKQIQEDEKARREYD